MATGDDAPMQFDAIEQSGTTNTAAAAGSVPANTSQAKQKPKKKKRSIPTVKEVFAAREIMLGQINTVKERLKQAEEIMSGASRGQSSNQQKQNSTAENLSLPDM